MQTRQDFFFRPSGDRHPHPRVGHAGSSALRPKLFYQHFGYAHLGALPLYAGAPVIAALGLSDMSVRLVAVIWSVAALLMLVALVRQLRWRNAEIAVVLFACTPVFIHLARINFGHAPSLFCVCAGLYAYVRGRDQLSWRWSALGGFALAASVYGQAAYYIAGTGSSSAASPSPRCSSTGSSGVPIGHSVLRLPRSA